MAPVLFWDATADLEKTYPENSNSRRKKGF